MGSTANLGWAVLGSLTAVWWIWWWLSFSSRQVWKQTTFGPFLSSFKGLPTLDVLRGIFPSANCSDRGCFCVILWCIWWNRNIAAHRGNPKSAADLVAWALNFLKEFQGTQQVFSTDYHHPNPPPKIGWNPPPMGTLKLNSDVAIREGLPFVGLGAAIRDNNGNIVAAISKPMQGFFDASVGEFLALREGLLLAKKFNLSVMLAEVDALNVAKEVNSPAIVNCAAKYIVKDIKELMKEVGNCLCQAISRVGNTLAHDLASLAISSGKEQTWTNTNLDCIFSCC